MDFFIWLFLEPYKILEVSFSRPDSLCLDGIFLDQRWIVSLTDGQSPE
jgi:hypothetical protein